MFTKRFLGRMRRSGFGTGVSKNKLSKYMLDILLQLPAGTTNLKETVVANMGMIGQMSASRDINAGRDIAKKAAAREFPEKFVLDARKGLHWNDGTQKILDKTISASNFKKLNELASEMSCSADQMVTTLIRIYKAATRKQHKG